ncbi:HeH/LEM domain-containing protein [Streptococcus uberis]|uniref:HeH/LEM domain-containing protein n=1 Tax=Streptococcus uberis TaxID=1349 RepID=UPI00214FBF44|nr:HeH/LEM domain-containing protein [Streptococcus uberis]MCR4258749.1 HeH/LEM domain-containing protein [Streptococcus uberis]
MAKVIDTFRDKDTEVVWNVGDEYTGAREAELIEAGVLEGDVKELTVDAIKAKLTELGVEFNAKANKPELLELLKAQG